MPCSPQCNGFLDVTVLILKSAQTSWGWRGRAHQQAVLSPLDRPRVGRQRNQGCSQKSFRGSLQKAQVLLGSFSTEQTKENKPGPSQFCSVFRLLPQATLKDLLIASCLSWYSEQKAQGDFRKQTEYLMISHSCCLCYVPFRKIMVVFWLKKKKKRMHQTLSSSQQGALTFVGSPLPPHFSPSFSHPHPLLLMAPHRPGTCIVVIGKISKSCFTFKRTNEKEYFPLTSFKKQNKTY